ncbi:Xylosyltransferase, family GT14 [Chondrus crispus]|uniref:Xylosyltransferase, family GT14 n=1 Tax=Chondrus crispus TaxID=2769 RepID=R7QRC6_CHOCR|nr:Xylosyltransferase, family GT14 [Chondrus crispus]CDF40313.1 Xylosyltransferase, family GT14 [Chondrus crispus]|eukprot:XP_005710607.1 Xylosyltransferase, family GT14 [Chondrus crispus]
MSWPARAPLPLAPPVRLLLPLLLLLLLLLPAQARAAPVSIAYFLQISEPTLALLPRLLRSVYHDDNLYVVHFDKKIPLWQRRHAETILFKGSPRYKHNVRLLPSEVVTYRGISMVLNLLSAMHLALDAHPDWTYFINLSGSDYPLVSVHNQMSLLASRDFSARNRSFFSFAEPDWWKDSKRFRYDRLYTDTSLSFNDSESAVVDSYSDQPISDVAAFTFAAAEAWMILHRDFASFVLGDSYARRMLLAFAYSLEPEEHFFATVAYNHPRFNTSNVSHSLRHVAWMHHGVHSGQHPYYIDQQEPDGKTWTFREEIENSACFFTRKVRVQDSGLLTYIDTHVNGISDNPNSITVNAYLAKVNKALDCVVDMPNGAYGGNCFGSEKPLKPSPSKPKSKNVKS